MIRPSLNSSWVGIAIVASLFLASSGCSTKSAPSGTDTPVPGSEFRDGASGSSGSGAPRRSGFDLGTVYFGFDQATIETDAQGILKNVAAELSSSGAAIVIEGHCDELGSEEYNLALGEKRADAVRRYLYNSGVPSNQMNTVTYGESRPAVNGTGENIWRLNRRAELRSNTQ